MKVIFVLRVANFNIMISFYMILLHISLRITL